MRFLRTNEIVVPRTFKQGHAVRQLTREDVIPNLLILRDEAGAQRPDIRSYTAALRRRMQMVRRAAGHLVCDEVSLDEMAPVRTVAARDMVHIVRDANADPSVHEIMVMSPTEEDFETIVAEIDPSKDVDGMNPMSDHMPCTPEAIIDTLEHHDLWRPDLRYTLVGRGRTVNSHVEAELRGMHGGSFDDMVRVVTRSNAGELPRAMARSDVAIVAAGVHHQVRPEMVHPDMQAVVGVCINDIDPSVYGLPHGTFITPVHLDKYNMGIGADTSSIAVQRTLEAAALTLAA